MTISITELSLYFAALVILFLTPGPVWIAIIARTVSGGAKSAFSLTLGVSLGDMLWPIIVFFGLGFLISIYADIFTLIRYLAALILSIMGLAIIWRANKGVETNEKLTGAGFFSGFLAGFIAITANPKAALFYLTLLPGFFNFADLAIMDLIVICLTSFSVPMIGNIFLILFLSRVREFISSSKSLFIMNITAGISLIVVSVLIGLT